MSYTDYRLACDISRAILRGEKKLKMPDGSIIDLPATQRVGTLYQIQSRANRAAIEIVEKWQKNQK